MTPQKIKFLVIALLCCSVCGIVASYLANKFTGSDFQTEEIRIDSDAALILNTMKQTSSKNGIKEWELEAKSARLLRNENRALLNQVSVVFHLNDGSHIHAKADSGTLFTATHDITFSGHVTVHYSTNELKTEQLHYKKKSHTIYSQVFVTISNETSSLQADSLYFDLNRNVIQMNGHVDAHFQNQKKD